MTFILSGTPCFASICKTLFDLLAAAVDNAALIFRLVEVFIHDGDKLNIAIEGQRHPSRDLGTSGTQQGPFCPAACHQSIHQNIT